ncbi:YidB family protein [Undibacterium flavidum]|uniref:DUF937 domain-containing protein n=1 Tax=Undibacterium flavidum TaxID=2762297 RepID=A0ABR6Y7A9_9BURK|nr:YidB family protein [Undibacterium flavidum]MBC3872047.1 DUF937 domain-containing protein [Undibacterium flavidum]
MGLLDTALGMLGNVQSSSGNSQQMLVQAALSMLNQSQNGGLQGLIGTFQNAGFGELIGSWVGTGQNLPISAEQIQQALGGGHLDQFANASGLSTSDTASDLANILPGLIDKLTPNGQVTDADNFDTDAVLQQFSSLSSLFNNR